MDEYIKGMFEKSGYMATWLPNASLKLGDVGVLADGFFQRVTSLGALNIEFTVRKGAQAIDYAHSSEEGVSMAMTAAGAAQAGPTGAVADIAVEFTSKGAFIFHAKGCVENAIEDQAKLARDVIARFQSGEDWDPDWVVINTVVEAKCATIMVSSSAGSKIKIGANAELPRGSAVLANADAGLHVTSQSGDVTNILAERGLTPMFRMSRIKRGILARLQVAMGGKPQVENVRSIGPQTFIAGEEPDESAGKEPDASADDEDAMEEVKPE